MYSMFIKKKIIFVLKKSSTCCRQILIYLNYVQVVSANSVCLKIIHIENKNIFFKHSPFLNRNILQKYIICTIWTEKFDTYQPFLQLFFKCIHIGTRN